MTSTPPEPDPSPAQARGLPRWRDRLAVAAFLLAFLIPMGLRATMRRGLPSGMVLAKLHNIACLFPNKPEGWSSYYIQLRYPGGVRWETLDQRELFPLQPFGRRTRYHRLMANWGAKSSPRTEELARWILLELVERHGDDPPPVAIRFARTWVVPTLDDPPPQSGWRHPDWLEVPPQRRRVIVTYESAELFPSPEPDSSPEAQP